MCSLQPRRLLLDCCLFRKSIPTRHKSILCLKVESGYVSIAISMGLKDRAGEFIISGIDALADGNIRRLKARPEREEGLRGMVNFVDSLLRTGVWNHGVMY